MEDTNAMLSRTLSQRKDDKAVVEAYLNLANISSLQFQV
jgi:hypothetical protein